MRLFIETIAGYTHKIDCEPSDRIIQVKEIMYEDFARKDE